MIYLDNACTTFPKPEGVAEAVYRYMTESGASVNRGGYERAYQVEEAVYEVRERLARLFPRGERAGGLHGERHREPQHRAQGAAAAGGPRPHLLGGAQRGHASPAAAGAAGDFREPYPLRPGRQPAPARCGKPAPGEHEAAGADPRLQRLRDGAAPKGGRGVLPPPRPSLRGGQRPDRRGAAPRHGGDADRRAVLHRPQGAPGAPGRGRVPASEGPGGEDGAADRRGHRQPQPSRAGCRSFCPTGSRRGR